MAGVGGGGGGARGKGGRNGKCLQWALVFVRCWGID